MVKVKQKMGPKLEGKVLKKGRRGAKKAKALKLQAENEVTFHKGNIPNLGAEAGSEREAGDLSLLSKPVEISVSGVHQLLKIFQNTTVEMRDLLSSECDLVYECKVCRSLYRSVANFLSHKRSYCREQYSDTRHVLPTSHRVEDQLVVIQPEPVPEAPCSETWATSDSTQIAHTSVTSNENLVTSEVQVSVPPISSYIRPKRNLSQIVEDLAKKLPTDVNNEPVGSISAAQFYTSACEKILIQRDVRREQTLHLEPMQGTSCGVFQTVIPPASSVENTDLMKTQVAELHGMFSANEATLGPVGEITVINGEGKTLPVDTSVATLKRGGKRKSTPFKTKTGIACNICNLDFETRKTFLHHNNRYHATSRVHYPCPCCRDTFANAWNVYRHLYKVHRKSSAQVRRLRPKVLSKVFMGKVSENESHYTRKKPRAVELLSEADKMKQEQERMEKENEDWMQNLEDDLGLQMCGGCGRRFERRAALNSHSQTCAKRIEVRKKANRFYPISTIGSSSSVQTSSIKVPLFMERAHTSRSEVLLKTEMANTENISSRLTPVSTHSEGTVSSGPKSGTSPAHSPLPHDTSSVPIPPVPATMYLRSPNSNGNPEKKIEIQIRRNYCKTEMGSVSTSTALGSAGCGSSHSQGKSGYHGTFPAVAATSGKLFEATVQDTISEQGEKTTALEKEILESNMPIKMENTDEGYEDEESKSHSNEHLPSCVIDTSSSEYNKDTKLHQIKEIKKCQFSDDSYEQAASKMNFWRNYPNQDEYSDEKFHLQKDCIDTDEVHHDELASKFSPQKDFVGKVKHSLVKTEAKVGSSKSTISKIGGQFTRQIKNINKGRRGKYDCYVSRMINGRKSECVMCYKRYNKVACRKRQVAFKIGYYRYQCMLCGSRYQSRILCLTHITNDHNIHKTEAPFQHRRVKIMLRHSVAFRVTNARVQRLGRKNTANDSNVDSSITVRKVEVNDKSLVDTKQLVKTLVKRSHKTEEKSTKKQRRLSEEKYTCKIQTGDENGNQNLILFKEHCDVKRTDNEESKEVVTEGDEVLSVTSQKKESRVVENNCKNDVDPKEEDSSALLDIKDRKEALESEGPITKSETSSMHTSSVDSDLILSEVSVQERQTADPKFEENSKEGTVVDDCAHKVENYKKSRKRRLLKVKNIPKERKCAVDEQMGSISAFDKKCKNYEQCDTPAYENDPDIIAAGLEKVDMNKIENTAAGTSKPKEIITENTSEVQPICKILDGKSSVTETVTKHKIQDNEAPEKHTSYENNSGKKPKLSKAIKQDTQMETLRPYSNWSNETMISGEACQLVLQDSCATNSLSSELMKLSPRRRSRRSDNNTDTPVDFTKSAKCQDDSHVQESSPSPNTVMLAQKCGSDVANIGGNIVCLEPLNASGGKSNSSNTQSCEVHDGMKQNVNPNCETDSPQDALSESCNGSAAKDGNDPLPIKSDDTKELRDDNQKKLKKTKPKQKRLQNLVTIKKCTVNDKESYCVKTVSDSESNETNNVDENGLNREKAGGQKITQQKEKKKSNKMSYLRSQRKGKIRLPNPADLRNAEPKLNRAESVGTNKVEKQPVLSKASGMEVSNVVEPSAENPSSSGKTIEQQTALRKLVMEVIFGSGQDCDTTQQLLSATLNGTQYDSQYAGSPSSSIETSPTSSACSSAFASNTTAAAEETLKTKDDGNIMTHKKTSSTETSTSSSCSAAFASNDTAAAEETLKTKDDGNIMAHKKTSSIESSPTSSSCSSTFASSDTAAAEETLKTKDDGNIMAHKKTVLNSFPEKKQRPVRNRIKLEREDFIYDLPERCRDVKRENEDKLSSCSTATRRQQTELAGSSAASSSESTGNLPNIPKIVLVRTSSVQAAKMGNDNSSSSTENSVGANEIFGAGSVAYKVSKRKSQLQDAKCKVAASSKERTD